MKVSAQLKSICIHSTTSHLNFPGGPEAETQCSQCRRPRFSSWLGNLTPHAPTKSSHAATIDLACCNEDWRSRMGQVRPSAAKEINKILKNPKQAVIKHLLCIPCPALVTWWGWHGHTAPAQVEFTMWQRGRHQAGNCPRTISICNESRLFKKLYEEFI